MMHGENLSNDRAGRPPTPSAQAVEHADGATQGGLELLERRAERKPQARRVAERAARDAADAGPAQELAGDLVDRHGLAMRGDPGADAGQVEVEEEPALG